MSTVDLREQALRAALLERAELWKAAVERTQRLSRGRARDVTDATRLIEDYRHTQESLSKLVHKSRSHIANLLRLLELPLRVRALVATGELTMGHARAIASAQDPESLADEVLKRGLSVRDTEKLARAARKPAAGSASKSIPPEANADIEALERQLGDMLGLKVKIGHKGEGGTVALNYSTLDQLDMICQRLSGEKI